jgi:hypothetical protein
MGWRGTRSKVNFVACFYPLALLSLGFISSMPLFDYTADLLQKQLFKATFNVLP